MIASIEEVCYSLSPVDVCTRLQELPNPLLLESGTGPGRDARYSFFMADPFLLLRGFHDGLQVVGGSGAWNAGDGPFETLRSIIGRYAGPLPRPDLPPFQGGAAGYFGYGLGRHLESLKPGPPDDSGLPEVCLGFYDWVFAWDHVCQRAWLISTGLPELSGARRRQRAAEKARELLRRLDAGGRCSLPAGESEPQRYSIARAFPVPGYPGLASDFSREGYLEAVSRVRDLIHAGDIFQANLSQRLHAPFAQHPLELYRRLRLRNPAPFAAYFDTGAGSVVSASPERFLRLGDRLVETRPIKGTAPRGDDESSDQELASALLDSAKDRAENIMIVDLLRNDLSRVCEDDSVQVAQLCQLESHPTVHHLVSTITARLKPECDAVDLLQATFPGGSITGAPKVRAMEVIAELEPTARGVYTGAIGYLGFDGSMDVNIAIRTFVVGNGYAYFRVGGGIVADSDPEREYEETLHKAQGLIQALEL